MHIEAREIQSVFRPHEGPGGFLEHFYLLDTQGRLWFFPAAYESLSFSNVEHSFENKIRHQGNSLLFMTSHLYEATHGRALHQPTYEEFNDRFDTYGYFRITDPFVIMENVTAISRVHRNDINTADFLVLTNGGYNYIITTHSRLPHIFPELFDRGSDMFMDFSSNQPPIVRLPFRNLVHVEYPFGVASRDYHARIELDIYGNVHTYGHGAIGDGIDRTNMPRRADNILSNVVQVGFFGQMYVALTSGSNLYVWGGGTNHTTPTRVLEGVSYFDIRDNLYVLMNNGELFRLSGFRDEEPTKTLSLFDVKLPQRRIIVD